MQKLICTTSLFVALAGLAFAQSPKATETTTVDGKTISIAYAAPKVDGRAGKLFGKDGRIAQDPNYPIWRAGANSSTKLHTDADLTIGGLAVPKGDYSLYVDLTNPAQWELVINKQTGQWGLKYDKSQDLGRVKMKMAKPPALVENLKYTLSATELSLAWENLVGSVPLTVK